MQMDEGRQIPQAEAHIQDGRISADWRGYAPLVAVMLPEGHGIAGVEIDAGRMARGLDTVASYPLRGDILYLRIAGGHVHDLRDGFGDVVVRQHVPFSGPPDVSIVPRRRPGRPRKIAGA
jgi:hypothetical protein